MGRILIGNTMEETAYHEAGHIVIAGAVGLDVQPKGIVIYEVEDVADGWAFYWEDNQQWIDILLALRAGQLAQLKQFPKSEFRGGQSDVQKFSSIVKQHFPPNCDGNMWQDISAKTQNKVDSHWGAIESVADAAMEASWIPVTVSEHPEAKRKKHLDGNTLVGILAKYKISARVR